MNLVKVTENNVDTAIAVQEELFPEESGRENYLDALKDPSRFEYWLVMEDGMTAGITGLYRYEEDPDSAWLGWFGIREPFRRRHLGSEVLRAFEERAKEKGFRFARLYTDAEDNDTAIAFYRANGYVSEPYLNPQDPVSAELKMLIFSKSLTGEQPVAWNSRNIHLTEQIEKQRKHRK